MKWNEVTKDYKFKDNSIVTQRHQTHLYDCYEIEYDGKRIVLSKDHILKIDISKLPREAQEEIVSMCNGKIPLTEDIHLQILTNTTDEENSLIDTWIRGKDIGIKVDDLSENNTECYVFNFPNRQFGVEVIATRHATSWENQKIDDNDYWVPVEGIAYLFGKYGKLDIGYTTIHDVKAKGKLPCFCVSTNTGQYELNGLKNHNSVYIQNVILHCLEHRDKIAVALVDPKQVEFSTYNGMNGVLGVATSTLEAAEILRIGRQVMYKRNKELQKLGLKNVAEYKPHEKSGKVFITGREIDENEQVKVRIDGEEKTMTAAELAEYLHNEE